MAVKVARRIAALSEEQVHHDEHVAQAVVDHMQAVTRAMPGGKWTLEATTQVMEYAEQCAARMHDPTVMWELAAEPLVMAYDELGVAPPAVLVAWRS